MSFNKTKLFEYITDILGHPLYKDVGVSTLKIFLAIRKKLYGDPVYKQNVADIRDRDRRLKLGLITYEFIFKNAFNLINKQFR